jgi:glycosyltransferase involved in cell wall biosynthesis
MLIFPSRGPESLSRVLLEASALGVPIAAMDTGGTRDIVEHGRHRPARRSPEGLAADVRRLAPDAALARGSAPRAAQESNASSTRRRSSTRRTRCTWS